MTIHRRPTWRAVEGSTVIRLVMPPSALCMATCACDGRAPNAQFGIHGKQHLLERVARMVAGWLDRQTERRRSRLALLELTDEQLKDIGLSRGEVDGTFERRPKG